MSRATFGVIGHVDHGKTALVAALTGTDTDRLPEEKVRGISIALGFAHLSDGNGTIADLIDMPGHGRFVHTMVSGASGIDAILLAVAADEGVREQTVEHADIAALLGVRHAVVAVTRCDRAESARTAQVADDALALLGERGISVPARHTGIATSATTGSGIAELRDTLLALSRSVPGRRADGPVWLPLDRVFTVPGHGPVVTGTLRGAELRQGDTLALLPDGRNVRVRAVQVHGRSVEAARPGERVAVNLRDVTLFELSRGMALATPGALESADWITIALRTVADAPALANGMRLRLYAGAAETDVRLRLLDRDTIGPDEEGFAQLHLARPYALLAGEHAILRIASPAQTVGGGRVLDPGGHRARRLDGALLLRLADMRDLSPSALVATEIARNGAKGTTRSDLARLTAFSDARLDAELAALPVTVARRGIVFPDADIATLAAQISALLAQHPAGLSRNQLLSALAGTRAAMLDAALACLVASGDVQRRGGQWHLPRPGEDAARAASEQELAARIAMLMQESGLAPPNPSALAVDVETRRAVDQLLRDGTLVRTIDRSKRREMLFHRDAIAKARIRLAGLLDADIDGEGLLVTEICAALGISRKFAMPLLDHLDSTCFTRRVGDRRVLFSAHAEADREGAD